MQADDCYSVGKIIKVHGFKGDLSIRLEVDIPEEYAEMESVFVEIGNKLVPFFISRLTLKHKGIAQIHFEDVDDEATARPLVGCELFLPLDLLPPLSGNQFYFHEIIGFEVVDTNFGPVGSITHVYDNQGQGILQVMRGEQEVLIPISDDVITTVDRDKKQMQVQCPDGLISLYLDA